MTHGDDRLALLPGPPSRLDRAAFLRRYGSVCENTPWIAERVFDAGLGEEHDSVEGLAAAFADVIAKADNDRQLAYVRAHPDLAGRAAVRGEMTVESHVEQSSAGLDQCSPEEFARLTELNRAYKQKFGFPFIMAVRGSSRARILEAFAERLRNSPDAEFHQALREIARIIKLRLHAIARSET